MFFVDLIVILTEFSVFLLRAIFKFSRAFVSNHYINHTTKISLNLLNLKFDFKI